MAAGFLFGQASEYEQGMALFRRGNAEGAVPHLIRATKAAPHDAHAWDGLGLAYAEQGLYEKAEPALRKACELDAKVPNACYFWARTLYALGRFEESLAALDRADGRLWRIRIAMGQAAEAVGKAERAEAEYKKAMDLVGGQDAGPTVAYGLFLVRQGRPADAVPVLLEAVKQDAKSAEAETYLGRALIDTGRMAEAATHLERAVALAPQSAQAHLLLAKAYVRLGRAEAAQPHFDAAAKYGTEK